VELPKYPVAASEAMPDESRTRRAAVALLVLEATLLGISLPVQLLVFVSLGWEGGDEALKQRMVDAMPLLGLAGLLAAVICGLGPLPSGGTRERHHAGDRCCWAGRPARCRLGGGATGGPARSTARPGLGGDDGAGPHGPCVVTRRTANGQTGERVAASMTCVSRC
jgi:hypothetical protein